MNNPTPKLQQLSTAEVRRMAVNNDQNALRELFRRREAGECHRRSSMDLSIDPINTPHCIPL